jgi:prepilin-type N-terminal cleavage/methylation domain-containing protein
VKEDAVARSETRDKQAGFSLVELMVAMVATLIIAGGVFKLVSAGNSAFRREPEMADRQQQVRMAMNVLAEDIMRAGFSMPGFMQIFQQGLNGVGPTGPSGQSSDEIEMLTSSDCPVLSVCDSDGVNIVSKEALSPCYALPNVAILVEMDPPSAGAFWAEKPGGGKVASCTGGAANNGHVNLPPGQSDLNYPGGPGFTPDYMLIGAVARYRINIDADGTPNLERSPTGGLDKDGNPWQVMARGIEELQVEYLDGNGWQDEPPVATCTGTCTSPTQADYDTIVRKIRVRLSARSLAPNLAGASTSAVGDAVRGELVSEFVPKAAMVTISMGDGEA